MWKSDYFRLSLHLRQFGLKIRDIQGDGNCMFRAVSDQMTGTQELHEVYRVQAVDFIRTHRDDFQPFIEDDEPFEGYLSRMSRLGTWGGNLELQALSLVLEVNISIFMMGAPVWEIQNIPRGRSISLSYHEGEHYNSVRRATDDTDEPAREINRDATVSIPVAELQISAWEDAVEYAKMLTDETDSAKLLAVLKTMFPSDDAPTIDILNECVGKLVDSLFSFTGEPLPLVPAVRRVQDDVRLTDPSELKKANMRPIVLPSNNDSCWCGSRKKYKRCCKSQDAFRRPEPEQLVTALSSLQI
jgi:OTU domain-containing protein 3